MTAPNPERLRQLLVAATPGPWQVETDSGQLGTVEAADGTMVAQSQAIFGDRHHARREANAALIAAAVSALPDLLAERSALLHQLAETERARDEWKARESFAVSDLQRELRQRDVKLAERDAEVQDLKQRLATGRAHRRAIIQDFCNERDRAESAERARDEATGLLREVAAWRLTVPPIAETPRKDGGIFGRIAAFLAASGGK